MIRKWWQGWRLALSVINVILAAGASVQAATYTVVHTFSGTDGGEPVAGLMQARDGNFYGTTAVGGNTYVNFGTPGYGVVYQLTPSGSYTVLHNFTSGSLTPNVDGQNPACQLIQGLSTDNNLYGTATNGGSAGGGTLFQMATDGSGFTTLRSFTGDAPGGYPYGGVIDIAGVLWGTGSNTTDYTTLSGPGAIFAYNLSTGAYTAQSFANAGGSTPVAPLILGQDGLLYGTGYYGGANNAGTIYNFDPTSFPTSNPTSFHDFGAANDGSNPQGSVYQAPDGAFYVTTVFGGANNTGTVAKYTFTAGVGYTNVWTTSFDSSAVWGPQAAVIMASDGFLYGTTGAGGPSENGDIYKVDPSTGTITDVYDFNGTTDGAQCQAPLLLGADGYLWGTTVTAGDPTAIMGTIFKFSLDPILTSISPTTVTAGNPGFTLTVNGADFNTGSTVRWNGTALTTTYVSPTQLTAAVPSTLLGSVGTATIDVQNRDLATSASATINIVAAPTITSISPTDVSATGPSFEMTITGTNFVTGDTVTVGGTPGITPDTLSSTTITVTVPDYEVFAAGTVDISVVTTDGVSSNVATLTVHAPSISSLSPAQVTAGNPGFNLTINGSYFPQGCGVVVNGDLFNPITPTSITDTQIVVPIPGSDITTAGTVSIEIQTGGGDGPYSNSVNLQVNAAPTATSLSPTDVTAGHPDFTLTITGTNFITGDAVSFGADNLTPTSLTSTQIQVTVPKADVATSGTVTVNVVTADGLSFGGLTFVVDPAPTITTLSPNELTVGHPDFTLTVTGTNFVSGDTVLFGTDTLTPAANTVTPTQIQVTVPSTDIATPGTVNVSVVAADGVASAPAVFTVDAAPVITSVSPTDVAVDGPAFPLTITGTGFLATDTVTIGGFTGLVPTSVTSTQIVVQAPASVLVFAGSVSVTVVSADGISSNSSSFTVHAPSITSISPTSVTAGNSGFTLTITGTYFVSNDQVVFGTDRLTPTSVTSTQIVVNVPATDVVTSGPVNVFVGVLDGVASNTVSFTVLPAPTITSLSPTDVTAGHPDFTLTITGTNFVSGDTVAFGANTFKPTSLSSTQIQVTVPAADVTTAGTISVAVATSDGVSSNASSFVVDPAPTISSLSPSSVTAGHADFTLTVTGTNFVSGDTVSFGSDSLTPGANTAVTATQIQVTVPATDVASAGSISVKVVSADGVASNAATFTVTAAPTITSISPTDAALAAASFPLTITGTNFTDGDTVTIGGTSAIAPSSLSQTQIVVTVPASELTTAGPLSVTIVTVDGVDSNSADITVHSPTITSLSPTSVTAGNAGFNLTITGTYFAPSATVNFGTASLTPTSVTSTQIVVAIPAADLTTAGRVNVSVSVLGGTASSNIAIFTILPAPTITSLSPTNVTAGHPSFTLTIAGTNFVSGDTVAFGADSLKPTSLTSTQIQVSVPNTDVATASSPSVSVVTADGVSSNAVGFTVNSAPAITTLSPSTVTAGHQSFTLTITGSGFLSGDKVKFGATALTPTSIGATQIQVTVPAADVATAGSVSVTVVSADGVSSNAAVFTVNPAPSITSISPTHVTAGHIGFTLTITGTNFANADKVVFGADVLTPTSTTATQIQVTVPAADVANAGSVAVCVATADGVLSNTSTFTVDPAPSITGLRPSSATAGHPSFTLFVTGTNFVSGDTILFGSATLTPVAMTSTAIQVTVPAADVASAGSVSVKVQTADAVDSNAATFTVNPAPLVTSISPTGVTAGRLPFTLTVTGKNFAAGDQVSFGSDTLTPLAANITPTSITVTVPSNDVATAGTLQVAVVSSDGVSSNSTPFTVAPAPVLASLNPNNTDAGGTDFTLAVNGSNFTANDVVQWNGASLTTTFVSATELDVTVPAANIAIAGSAQVTAITTDGVASNPLTFAINQANPRGGAPTITTISPSSATAGDPAFTLTVTGTNYVSGDTVNWNGQPLTTTFVSATELTAGVPASDIAVAGNQSVTVTDLLGNTSNIVTFTVNAVHTFPAGLQLDSVPYDYTGDPLSTIVSETNPLIAVWDPVNYAYALSPTSPADTLHQGRGFWVHFHQPTGLLKKGTDETTSTHLLTVPLSTGWNMIGDPYTVATPLSSLVVVDASGNHYTLAEANAKGLVYSVLYSYDSASNAYVTHSADSLQPYVGYWICAFSDCKLEMPTPIN